MPTCEIAPTGADRWGYPRVRSRLATEAAGAAHVVDSSPSREVQAASCRTTHSATNVADRRPGGLLSQHQTCRDVFVDRHHTWCDRIGGRELQLPSSRRTPTTIPPHMIHRGTAWMPASATDAQTTSRIRPSSL